MADKLQTFTTLLATLITKTFIAANQGHKLPAHPFFTYQSINEDRDNLSIDSSVEVEEVVTETRNKRVENIIQFDVYASSLASANTEIQGLVDAIEYKYRETILANNFGIVEIRNIIDNTSLEETKTMWRKTVEITIDYVEAITRTTTNMQSIEYQLDTDDEKTVSRE